MDEIRLVGLVFYGTHGVNPEEKALGQRFRVDLSYWIDAESATNTDKLDATVSYSAIYKLVKAELEGDPSQLLEHLAGRVLRRVLGHDQRILKARVEIAKLSPPLRGSETGQVAVVMLREQGWQAVTPTDR